MAVDIVSGLVESQVGEPILVGGMVGYGVEQRCG